MSKPPRLGRGLSALLGDAAVSPASGGPGLRSLPIAQIEPGPFQPREAMDEASLAELAASVREHGVLQPILVRPLKGEPGRYQIIGGERRWRAAQAAGLHEVPVLARDFSDREAMAAGLVENLQRQDLNALEEAEGYGRLVEQFGLTQEALARAVGKSRPHVANTLRLLGLPERVRDLLREGALTPGHARALLTAKDPVALALQVVDRGLNVRQAEALAGAREPPARLERPTADAATRALERTLTAHLGLRVAIRHGERGGQLVLTYRDLDQLEGLIRLLKPA